MRMKTLTSAMLGCLGVASCVTLAGCVGSSGGGDDTESAANPGEDVGVAASALSVSTTLYYEGACSWLKCANGNSATGACGFGCNDTIKRFARDQSWRMSCGQSVQVTAKGLSTFAAVWDQSCCSRMEGNDALLTALTISHGDGKCTSKGNFTYGFGQNAATFFY